MKIKPIKPIARECLVETLKKAIPDLADEVSLTSNPNADQIQMHVNGSIDKKLGAVGFPDYFDDGKGRIIYATLEWAADGKQQLSVTIPYRDLQNQLTKLSRSQLDKVRAVFNPYILALKDLPEALKQQCQLTVSSSKDIEFDCAGDLCD